MQNERPKVVVVNDNPNQLEILAWFLNKAGIASHAFESVEAALAAMDPAAPPDLVVTDLYMPGIDGWRFCRLLRSPEYVAFNAIPLLVVSATFAGDQPERIAADIGADAFLPIPVDKQEFVAQARALLAGRAARRQPRVLIVEDHADLAEMLQEVFAAHGYRADTAASVRAAEAAFHMAPYDVAVMDYHLPDGRGDALLDAFQAKRPDCVCLMMTGDPTPELALAWMKRGASAYLRKPFEPELIIELCTRARRERALLRAEELLEARTCELRESEAYHRALFESVSDAVLVHEIGLDGLPGKFVAANRVALEQLAYTREELLKLTPRDIAADDAFKALAEVRANLANRGDSLFETVHHSRDGRRIPVECHVNVLELDGKRVAISVVRDLSERKRAEARLRESEERHRSLFMEMQEGFALHEVICDTAGQPRDYRYLEVNPAFERATGIPRERWTGHTVREVLPDVEEYWIQRFGAVALTGKAAKFENYVRQLDRYYEVVAYSPKLGQFAVIALDITERKRAEAELLAQRERVQNIAANLPGVVYQFYAKPSGEYGVSYVSERVNEILELPGDTDTFFTQLVAHVHIDDRDAFMASIQAAVATVSPWRFEGRFVKPSGGVYWFSGASNPIQLADRILFDGLLLDITARKQAEEQLRESEAIQRDLLLNMPAGVVIVDPETRLIEQVNEHAAALFGTPVAALLGQRCHPTLCPAEAGLCPVCDLGKPVANSECMMVRADGSQLPILKTVKRVSLGGRMKLLECFVDISDRKRAEADREKLQAQLTQAQKMESVGRLAGGVAHDFNNMLQAILGHADLVLQDLPPDSPFHDNLVEIKNCAQRSADLTRQLLAFARKQTIAPKVLDLNETVEGLLRMLRRLIGENIDLAWRPGRHLWPVRLDPSQVDQILANLCVNARDAIADVGQITLETDNATFDAGQCAQHPGFTPGDYVMLAVNDNGCGMDAETLSHLFEPFFTTKEVGKGTGLGLATVYGAVKQNHGFINVHSEPGRGTTFKIFLPRHAVKAAQELDERKPHPSGRGSETILLVEDEPVVLNLIQQMLEHLGYTVLTADTPGKAVRLATEHPGRIDLLLTDVVMPEMNGRDLARNILALHPNIKRLFSSGYTADVIAHQGVLDAGIHFIQKPFSPHSLGAKVREALEN